MLRACGADEKERVARAIHKLKVAVHMVVFPVGGLKAKNARHSGESMFFKKPMERKKTNRTNKGAIGAKKVREVALFPSVWGSQKWCF